MKEILSSKIITPELAQGAIINDEHPGFREDYLVLHCLLRKYKPRRFFEIGTNFGTGTNIICNALGEGATVCSLDLPDDMSDAGKQGKGLTGSRCKFPYTQILGDSLNFDYSEYWPIDGWFIDGAHDFEHAYHESIQAFIQRPRIIIWHDTDVKEVVEGIYDALYIVGHQNFDFFRVTDTRISYAIPSDSNN